MLLELPNGDLQGGQAKFFRETPKPSQWKQIDESVERALSKHRTAQSFGLFRGEEYNVAVSRLRSEKEPIQRRSPIMV